MGLEIAAFAAMASAGVQALGAIQQSRAQSAALEFNAQENRRNAALVEEKTAAEEARFRREARFRAGAARVAARGNTGSALDIFEDNAMAEELDALAIRHRGALEARGLRVQAGLDEASASNARRGGIIGAGAALLSGVAQAGDIQSNASAGNRQTYNPATGSRGAPVSHFRRGPSVYWNR